LVGILMVICWAPVGKIENSQSILSIESLFFLVLFSLPPSIGNLVAFLINSFCF
jgi:hypothetical protein